MHVEYESKEGVALRVGMIDEGYDIPECVERKLSRSNPTLLAKHKKILDCYLCYFMGSYPVCTLARAIG